MDDVDKTTNVFSVGSDHNPNYQHHTPGHALSHANVICTPGSLIQTSIDEIAGCSIERWDLSSVVQIQQSIS